MSQPLDPEQVDLAILSQRVQDLLKRPVEANMEGRTALRDATVQVLGCSQLEAEQLVDTLFARGFVRQERSEDGPWIYRLRLE